MPARRRTRSEALEPAILAAAGALLESEGPEGLSIRRIAERAQVAPMGLYSRFDGKHGVVDALCVAGFAELTETMRAAAAAAVDPAAGVRAAATSYRALALAHPARYALLFSNGVPGYEPSEAARAAAAGALDALGDAARLLGEARPLRVGTATAAVQLLAACHGFVALELQGRLVAVDRDAAFGSLLDALLDGLGG